MSALTANKLRLKPAEHSGINRPIQEQRWKILVVDDEEEVHSVTKFALRGYEFKDRPLTFLHAYSGEEAKEILRDEDDIALVLLDVVMETDHAGLDVVGFIRDELKNKLTRIVLRTGQPGQAPEKKVIINYDINDYKEKTELTSQKLFTLLSASLRSYCDLVALEDSRKGLRKIIEASADIFSEKSMQGLAEGALDQLLSLLKIKNGTSFYGRKVDSLAALKIDENFEILAGTGDYSRFVSDGNSIPANPFELEKIIDLASQNGHVIENNQIVYHHRGYGGHENILYLSGDLKIAELDRELIELYAQNVGIIFENADLNRQVEETQREIVYRLGEAAETRSMETGNHLRRVAEISKLLALKYGLSEEEAELIKYASPLHDVGKIGIPDAVLNKPDTLTPDEWDIMKSHAELGHKMLASSNKPILRAGAIIALEHHEKWDGSGYPNGKSGDDIHIYGRITALADVFDALAHKRCYKVAWDIDDVFTYIERQSGQHFEPALVDLLLTARYEFKAILREFAD
jgi:response regulator RpfG family c-di-GMP phosphodiesterase